MAAAALETNISAAAQNIKMKLAPKKDRVRAP